MDQEEGNYYNIEVNIHGIRLIHEGLRQAVQKWSGAGLTKSGNQIDANGTLNRILVNADDIDISPNYVGQTSLTTLGTITTGTWNADIVGLAYGGTAVDNTNITDGEIFMGPNFVDGTSPGSAGFREFLTTDVAPITGGSFDGGTF